MSWKIRVFHSERINLNDRTTNGKIEIKVVEEFQDVLDWLQNPPYVSFFPESTIIKVIIEQV